MWRLANGEHGGDQVIQRPGQVVLSDEDNPVIDAKMVDRPSRNRVVGRWGSQGACGQVLPRADVARRGGVNHPARMVPSWLIRVATTLISSVCSLRPYFAR
jgi:hypothetical protein